MISMTRKKRKSRDVPVGEYIATVTRAEYSPYYDPEDSAFVVTYRLENKNGDQYSFRETFLNTKYCYNDRTSDLLEYLHENGIEINEPADFVGCVEKVLIKKVLNGDRSYKNIITRDFVAYRPTEDTIPADEN